MAHRIFLLVCNTIESLLHHQLPWEPRACLRLWNRWLRLTAGKSSAR